MWTCIYIKNADSLVHIHTHTQTPDSAHTSSSKAPIGSCISIHPNLQPGIRYFLAVPPHTNTGTLLATAAMEWKVCPENTISAYISSLIIGR